VLSDLTGSAVVLDQIASDPARPCTSDRLQPAVENGPRFMKVSWNAAEIPPGYSSLGGDVIFVARPDGYERLTYPVQLTKVFQGRLAVCWQVRGAHQSRVWIHWKTRPAEPAQIARISGELNEELRLRHRSSSQSVRRAFPRKRWTAIALIVLIGLAIGLLRHFFFGGGGGRHQRAALPHYERNQRKERVIVFVHGLFGDATSTWTCPAGAYWPSMILKDHAFDDSDIYIASYDTPYVGNRMTIDDVVANLDNRLESDRIFEHQDVVFVVHSLGGLIVQRFLLTHREYAKQVKLIYFFSTPETGAQVAKVGSVFSQDPLLREMFPGDENDYLQNLEMEWRAAGFGSIRRYCAYETRPTNGILVVDRLSGTRNCGKAVALNEDHFSIVKPCSTEDDAYTALRNAVEENPAPLAESARWVRIDPIRPPEFAKSISRTLTGVDSPLTAVEWDQLRTERKHELPAEWIVFGSPEYDASAAPAKITFVSPASARIVAFVLNNNGGDWHLIEKTEFAISTQCKKCSGSSGKLRFLVLVFPLDRTSYDLIAKERDTPEQFFRSEAN
jgi:pimeloyl-ACP methyl ester carboxylesterase